MQNSAACENNLEKEPQYLKRKTAPHVSCNYNTIYSFVQ